MNPKLKRLIDETEKLTRQITNLKSKVRRRQQRLIKTFDPLERQRIEAEIELLKKKVSTLRLDELKCSIPIIEALANFGEEKLPKYELDWEKAGKA
jgi:hypothetical protein